MKPAIFVKNLEAGCFKFLIEILMQHTHYHTENSKAFRCACACWIEEVVLTFSFFIGATENVEYELGNEILKQN